MDSDAPRVSAEKKKPRDPRDPFPFAMYCPPTSPGQLRKAEDEAAAKFASDVIAAARKARGEVIAFDKDKKR